MSSLHRVGEVATQLGVSVATVYGLVAAGKLRCHRVGLGRGVIRVSDQQVDEFLAGAEPMARSTPTPTSTRQVRLKHLRPN